MSMSRKAVRTFSDTSWRLYLRVGRSFSNMGWLRSLSRTIDRHWGKHTNHKSLHILVALILSAQNLIIGPFHLFSWTNPGQDYITAIQLSGANCISYLENWAADIRGAAVSRQLHHQLLQEVCDDCRREELPALSQDLTDTQGGSGAHSGMRVIKKCLRMIGRWFSVGIFSWFLSFSCSNCSCVVAQGPTIAVSSCFWMASSILLLFWSGSWTGKASVKSKVAFARTSKFGA